MNSLLLIKLTAFNDDSTVGVKTKQKRENIYYLECIVFFFLIEKMVMRGVVGVEM